jgi:peptide deformylase
LAAIQIGYPVRAFVLKDKDRFISYINPQVKELGGTVFSKEGCLSFPNKKRVVKRHKEVVLTTGTVLQGFMAIAFQHEHEHLGR